MARENEWGEPMHLDDNGVPRRLHSTADTWALLLVALVGIAGAVFMFQDCQERTRREVCGVLLEVGAEQRILDRYCGAGR